MESIIVPLIEAALPFAVVLRSSAWKARGTCRYSYNLKP